MFPDLCMSDASFMVSTAGCEEQCVHRDIDTSDAYMDHLKAGGAVPLSVIIALQGRSTVTVWKGSHNLVEGEVIPKEVLALERFQMFIFRQDLIHHGDGYLKDNIRLHVFLDPIHKLCSFQREMDVVGVLNAQEKKCISQ